MGIIETAFIGAIIVICAVGTVNILLNYLAREEALDRKLAYWEEIIASR